jgi:deoxyribonuclease IV
MTAKRGVNPPRSAARRFFGAHVSAAGGLENAPRNALDLGADCFALFLKNQRRWESPPIEDAQADRFRAACGEFGFTPSQILPHDGYLINMGSPEPRVRDGSCAAFLDEMRRCERLGLTMLNFHPGSHKGLLSDEACLDLVAQGVRRALDATRGVAAIIENTAGQGGSVGRSFEQIAYLLDRIGDEERAGVCLDTCHLFAAGYDLSTPESYERALGDFEATVGLGRLRAMHLNDAKGVLGGHLDRHQSLGDGSLGWETFRRIVNDPRLGGIPLILETPESERWAEEIRTLRSFVREAP